MLNVQHEPQWSWFLTTDTAPRSLQSRRGGGERPVLRPSARYWLSWRWWVAEQFWLMPRGLPKPRRVAWNSSLPERPAKAKIKQQQ